MSLQIKYVQFITCTKEQFTKLHDNYGDLDYVDIELFNVVTQHTTNNPSRSNYVVGVSSTTEDKVLYILRYCKLLGVDVDPAFMRKREYVR